MPTSTASKKEKAKMADIITQGELKSVLETYNALGQTILGIRRRIEAGATVEEGIYAADSNRGDPISEYERTIENIGLFGLDLEAKELPSDVPAESEPALPDWLTVTPHECKYFLALEEGGLDCQECQNIDLTRKEFLILKTALAKMRSISIPLE